MAPAPQEINRSTRLPGAFFGQNRVEDEKKNYDILSINETCVQECTNDLMIIDSAKTESHTSDDPWGVIGVIEDASPKWSELDRIGKFKRVLVIFSKIIGVLGSLYFFVCFISLMAGKTAGELFSSPILKNPVSGVIIGMLVTVLVQSSSTSTTIIVTMVGAGILDVHEAIPMIMGANIGTSVTNTIVALTRALNVDEFRRAFAGATVLDMFNLLSVVILLPIEVVSGYLERVSEAILSGLDAKGGQGGGPEMLDYITDPLTDQIIKINKTIIELVALDVPLQDDASMIKTWCEQTTRNYTYVTNGAACDGISSPCNVTEEVVVGVTLCTTQDFLFANTAMSDAAVGVIILVISLVGLTGCLIMLVKLLSSMMKGTTSLIIKKILNNRLPGYFGWLTGYLAIIAGAVLTFVVQSSSVFTSAITPLCGMGVISLKRMYALTLGANIGTCTTSLLAALATESSGIQNALQISLCHLFFNLTGIVIWYPIPFMRHIPIRCAKFLGNTTSKYRWFAVMYLIMVFFIIPLLLLGLSIAGTWVMVGFLIVAGVIIVLIIILNKLQRHRPHWLHTKLKTWEFLPLPMRSLQPYDEFLLRYICRCSRFQPLERKQEVDEELGNANTAFEEEDVTKF